MRESYRQSKRNVASNRKNDNENAEKNENANVDFSHAISPSPAPSQTRLYLLGKFKDRGGEASGFKGRVERQVLEGSRRLVVVKPFYIAIRPSHRHIVESCNRQSTSMLTHIHKMSF